MDHLERTPPATVATSNSKPSFAFSVVTSVTGLKENKKPLIIRIE